MKQYEKNDIISVRITDLGKDGEGIGKIDNFPFFIKGAIPGDLVEASVMKVKKNYAFARLLCVTEPSAQRVDPVCPVFGKCGGCQLQNMEYASQLEYKQKRVMDSLEHIGGVDRSYLEQITQPIIGMEDPYRYRNKAVYPIGRGKDQRSVAGFFAHHSHRIVEQEDCVIGPAQNRALLRAVLDWMDEQGIAPYDEETGRGRVRHVMIRQGYSTGQTAVTLIVNENCERFQKQKDKTTALVDALRKADPGVCSVSLNENRERGNRILGERNLVLYGRDHIEDELLGLTYRISPQSFYQVNPVQTRRLYETAIEFASLQGDEEVWDICCGIGTISLAVASRLGDKGRVHGIEIVDKAIEDAKENARINGIKNADFICAAAEDYLVKNRERIRADVVILDPPRKGMAPEAIDAILTVQPARIVYVSCDPATLARDIRLLAAGGYEPKRVRACDMFCHSCHVETVALLSKLSEAKHHIEVKVDMDELDLTSAEAKATYKEIQDWVQEKYGFHVTNLNIAQGFLLGTIDDNNNLHFDYRHINTEGESKSGECHSEPRFENGKLRFYEKWKWTSGCEGTSVIEEL